MSYNFQYHSCKFLNNFQFVTLRFREILDKKNRMGNYHRRESLDCSMDVHIMTQTYIPCDYSPFASFSFHSFLICVFQNNL